ncbi:MAG: MFS transporter [bacterium]
MTRYFTKSAAMFWTSRHATVSDSAIGLPAVKARPLRPFQTVLRYPTLRLIAVALLLLGMHNASVYPYQSVIAIERIGLSKQQFALLLVLASAVAVTASVLFGMLTDQYGHRRRIALITALASTLGIAMMLLHPSPLTLVLCQGILLPMAWSIYGQLFTLARLASPEQGRGRDAILGSIRSLMSLGFLATLIFWTFAFASGAAEMRVYLTGGIASLAMALLILVFWPKEGTTSWDDPRSGLNLKDAFRAISTPHILMRLIFIGALSAAGNLYFVLISLVFEASPVRDASDVALYVGMVAGWEVPFMLILPRLTQHVSRSTALALGAVVYTTHLAALPYLGDTPLIWLMPIFAGAGGAVILMLPIPYYQDLIHGRPGTASAMLALQKLVVDVLTAAIFALGTAIGGFEMVALIGTAVSLLGALCLYLADRHAWFPVRA